MIVGLTGGIASGKSTVAEMFHKLGAYIIDADKIARLVVERGKPALQEIAAAFGTEVLEEDGSLNRSKLGEIIFRDESSRLVLNQIVHPRVRAEVQAATSEWLRQNPDGIVFHDIPLLFESHLEHTVETIVVVFVQEETQLQRLMERNHYTAEEAKQRISAQMPLQEKVKQADFLVNNEGTLEQTFEQVKDIWYTLRTQGRIS